jgi:hypothetical protein
MMTVIGAVELTYEKSADTISSAFTNQGTSVAHPRGILLVNLGSPKAPSVTAVRRYLNEFLMDPRVLDVPWPVRRAIVSLFILPFRPKQTAAAYASIWANDPGPEGAPLLRLSRSLADQVAEAAELPLALAMRYGEPSIADGIDTLLSAGVDEILLVALYPHHADSTQGACRHRQPGNTQSPATVFRPRRLPRRARGGVRGTAGRHPAAAFQLPRLA